MANSELIKKAASDFFVLKFNSYQTPEFKEQKNKEWIKYGEKNDYPSYLIQLYQRSGKHSAIINSKVDYIIGKGFEASNNDPKVKAFIDGPNSEENAYELGSKLATDIEIFNGSYIEVIQPKGRKGQQQLRLLPFHRIRTNADCTLFYYTKDWSKFNPEKNDDWRVLPAYDPNKPADSSVFYYQGYTPKDSTYPVYPLPEYQGSIPWIEIDYEIANFHLNNIKNSFWGSFLINFYNGIPEVEKMKDVEKRIKGKFTSTDNAGRVVINFADSKETGADMQSLTPNELDKMFDLLNKTVQQEIFIGHKITSPMLFGIRVEGQLGGRSEMLEAYELFKQSYVVNKQRVIEDIFNYLLTGNRNERVLKLTEKPPLMMELPLTDPAIQTLFSRDELREIAIKQYGLNLKPQAAPSVTGATQMHMHDEELEQRILSRLEQAGRPASEFEILKVRSVDFEMNPMEVENRMYRAMFAAPVSGKVSDIALNILKVFDRRPDASISDIAAQLKVSPDRVKASMKELKDAGYLDDHNYITPMGDNLIPSVNPESKTISVRYRYAKDPMVSGPIIIPTSREFCKRLVTIDKLYTRAEIEQISNEEGYSVFLFRGGWYHNPTTKENQPYCRHLWESTVVTEVNGGGN